MSKKHHIKKEAVKIGKILGYEYWIINRSGFLCSAIGHNGYVVFPKRIVREKNYAGILTYVPVHGGITYAKQSDIGMVYGFDTGHCDSNEYPINDIKWIKKQCSIMIKGILRAKEVEDKYLRCKTNAGKCKHVQYVHNTPHDYKPYNFGVNINLLTGHL